jgi:multiple sugar transport system permease protein
VKSSNRANIATRNTDWFAYRFITPVILFFIVWNVIPVLWMVGLGFYKYVMISAHGPVFVGLKNYLNILNDEKIWNTFRITFTFVVIGVFVETCLGILLGFLFWGSKNMPGRRLALTLLFAPMVLTPVASGLFFKLILDPTFGILNYSLDILFNTQINFLGDSLNAFISILLVDIWMWTPFLIMMTLAALGSVPSAELEAAEIDRLSFYSKFRYIIWPHGKFILILGILLRTIESFKSMDVVFTMTFGGPGNATELLGISLYRKAFESFKMGESSSLSIIALLVAIGFTAIFLEILNKRKKVDG